MREAASRKRWFRRRSFWQVIVDATGSSPPSYIEYCYREQADRYRLRLDQGFLRLVNQAAGELSYPTLRNQVCSGAWEEIDFLVAR
jgi:hypothetical protein